MYLYIYINAIPKILGARGIFSRGSPVVLNYRLGVKEDITKELNMKLLN